MRVVGGEAKGRKLKGTISREARPTTERVRAAIFNIVHPEAYQGLRILDLYAGSGSLGIEALSRGAVWADFVEKDRRQCAVIQANLEHTGMSDRASVHCSGVVQALSRVRGPYSLVLMDPPYRLFNLGKVLKSIASTIGLVVDAGEVIVGHSRHLELLPEYGSLYLISNRRYGDNVVEFFRQGDRAWLPPFTPEPLIQ